MAPLGELLLPPHIRSAPPSKGRQGNYRRPFLAPSPRELASGASLKELPYFKPSLCKGGCRAKRGGRVVRPALRKRNNPSVRLVPRLPPPLAQGRLSRKRFSRSDEEGKKCAPQPKNLPRGRKIGCFFCRFPVKYCLHLFGCIRDARLLHPCVPLLCRDGGAAERARFEIVLGSDVYQGSNPCLCATEKGCLLAALFRAAERV